MDIFLRGNYIMFVHSYQYNLSYIEKINRRILFIMTSRERGRFNTN